jgi:isoquinoline 1-oxidoreductase beta subunit
MKRRDLLRWGMAAGGVLAVQMRLPLASAAEGDAAQFGALLRLHPDGSAELLLARHEMGQGVSTGLATALFEELDVPWTQVRVSFSPFHRAVSFGTGGSTTLMSLWLPLRKLGALVRERLLAAAAARWQVDVAACEARAGWLHHRASGRSLRYADVAAAASREPLPAFDDLAKADIALKPAAKLQFAGRERPNVTAPDIVRGRLRYGIDLRLPGMLIATVVRCPHLHGGVKAFNAAEVKRLPGVRGCARIGGYHGIDLPGVPETGGFPFVVRSGVAVWGDDTWAVLQARRRLSVRWTLSAAQAHDSDSFARFAAGLIAEDGPVTGRRGAAVAEPMRQHRADYEYPHQAHTPMEPLSCAAHWRADGTGCDLWVATQSPGYLAAEVMRLTGLSQAQVRIHLLPSGGSFGRRFFPDFAIEALLVSREAGHRLVKLMWTREDDVATNHYHAYTQARFEAGVRENGNIRHWRQTEARTQWSRRKAGDKPEPPERGEVAWMPYAAAMVEHAQRDLETHTVLPSCAWRSVVANAWMFGQESFVDELALAAKRDPLAYRLAHLANPAPRDLGHGTPFQPARLRAVLETAARAAGWPKAARPGWAQGIAAAPYMHGNSYCAVVAEVAITGTEIRVERIVCAVDCGLVVNPSTARQQVEGGVIWAMTAALHGGVRFKNGQVRASNFHDMPILRLPECPSIEVHWVPGEATAPTGIGEIAGPPTVPAIANAIAAATGQRLRRLPLRLA